MPKEDRVMLISLDMVERDKKIISYKDFILELESVLSSYNKIMKLKILSQIPQIFIQVIDRNKHLKNVELESDELIRDDIMFFESIVISLIRNMVKEMNETINFDLTFDKIFNTLSIYHIERRSDNSSSSCTCRLRYISWIEKGIKSSIEDMLRAMSSCSVKSPPILVTFMFKFKHLTSKSIYEFINFASILQERAYGLFHSSIKSTLRDNNNQNKIKHRNIHAESHACKLLDVLLVSLMSGMTEHRVQLKVQNNISTLTEGVVPLDDKVNESVLSDVFWNSFMLMGSVSKSNKVRLVDLIGFKILHFHLTCITEDVGLNIICPKSIQVLIKLAEGELDQYIRRFLNVKTGSDELSDMFKASDSSFSLNYNILPNLPLVCWLIKFTLSYKRQDFIIPYDFIQNDDEDDDKDGYTSYKVWNDMLSWLSKQSGQDEEGHLRSLLECMLLDINQDYTDSINLLSSFQTFDEVNNMIQTFNNCINSLNIFIPDDHMGKPHPSRLVSTLKSIQNVLCRNSIVHNKLFKLLNQPFHLIFFKSQHFNVENDLLDCDDIKDKRKKLNTGHTFHISGNDFFNYLPNDIVTYLVKYLTPKRIHVLSQISCNYHKMLNVSKDAQYIIWFKQIYQNTFKFSDELMNRSVETLLLKVKHKEVRLDTRFDANIFKKTDDDCMMYTMESNQESGLSVILNWKYLYFKRHFALKKVKKHNSKYDIKKVKFIWQVCTQCVSCCEVIKSRSQLNKHSKRHKLESP